MNDTKKFAVFVHEMHILINRQQERCKSPSGLAGGVMTYEIMPIAEEHIASFRETVDFIAREEKFLPFLDAPALERMRPFVLTKIREKQPHFVVVNAGTVVGWCEVELDLSRVFFAHRGGLGVGLLPEYRGKGIGRELMRKTIEAAFDFGLTRIELTVREQNVNAIALYKKFGFETEGLQRNALRLQGRYENLLLMAIVRE